MPSVYDAQAVCVLVHYSCSLQCSICLSYIRWPQLPLSSACAHNNATDAVKVVDGMLTTTFFHIKYTKGRMVWQMAKWLHRPRTFICMRARTYTARKCNCTLIWCGFDQFQCHCEAVRSSKCSWKEMVQRIAFYSLRKPPTEMNAHVRVHAATGNRQSALPVAACLREESVGSIVRGPWH